MKNEANFRYEFGNIKNISNYKPINDIIYSWFKTWEPSVIYVNGPLLKEEAMNIK